MRSVGLALMLMMGVSRVALAQAYDVQAAQEVQEAVAREATQQTQTKSPVGLGDVSLPNTAQDMTNMTNLIAQVQNVQSCMQAKNPQAFSEMNRQGYAVQQQVAQLCKSGSPDKAQKVSLAFAQSFKQSSAYHTMTECAPPAYLQMAENMITMAQPQSGSASVQVCDHIQQVQGMNR